MLSPSRATFRLRISCSTGRGPHPRRQPVLDLGVLPMADDDLARLAHPRADEAELAVAVGRLVEVHEVHVDRRPGQVAVELRVQVAIGFSSDLRPAIHILAGEKVCIQQITPDAIRRGVGLAAHLQNRLRRGHHRLEHHADRQPRRGVELLDDAAAVLGHLPERFFAIEVLAARNKPRFERFQFITTILMRLVNAPILFLSVIGVRAVLAPVVFFENIRFQSRPAGSIDQRADGHSATASSATAFWTARRRRGPQVNGP